MSGFSIFIASEIIGPDLDKRLVLLLSVIVMLFTSGANALNDALDLKIDLINRPLRPIPSGKVNIKTAFLLSFIFFIFASILCLQLNKNAEFIGIFIAMPIMTLYTTYLKNKPLIGNFSVAFILSLSFIFCGAAFNSINPMIIPTLLCFGLSFLRELVKDMADIEGDKSSGLSTFPIYSGFENSIKLVIIISFLIGLGSFIPFLNSTYNLWYLFFLILGVEIPILFIVFLMLKKPSIKSAEKSAKVLKFSTFMGLIAIYTGTIL